jgi:hypothetical protein
LSPSSPSPASLAYDQPVGRPIIRSTIDPGGGWPRDDGLPLHLPKHLLGVVEALPGTGEGLPGCEPWLVLRTRRSLPVLRTPAHHPAPVEHGRGASAQRLQARGALRTPGQPGQGDARRLPLGQVVRLLHGCAPVLVCNHNNGDVRLGGQGCKERVRDSGCLDIAIMAPGASLITILPLILCHLALPSKGLK